MKCFFVEWTSSSDGVSNKKYLGTKDSVNFDDVNKIIVIGMK